MVSDLNFDTFYLQKVITWIFWIYLNVTVTTSPSPFFKGKVYRDLGNLVQWRCRKCWIKIQGIRLGGIIFKRGRWIKISWHFSWTQDLSSTRQPWVGPFQFFDPNYTFLSKWFLFLLALSLNWEHENIGLRLHYHFSPCHHLQHWSQIKRVYDDILGLTQYSLEVWSSFHQVRFHQNVICPDIGVSYCFYYLLFKKL